MKNADSLRYLILLLGFIIVSLFSFNNGFAQSTGITATISASDPDAGEPDNDGQFTVTLSETPSGPATIQYRVTGSATPNQDYVALSGSVFIDGNQSSAIITVDVIDDALIEDPETVIVTLTSGSIDFGDDVFLPIEIGEPASATVNIVDDDFATAAISASDPDAGEPNNDGEFTVTLSEALNETATVQYSVSGSAIGGQDYVALSGSVSIPAGAQSATIPVNVLDDTELEGEEEVIVTLTSGDPLDVVVIGSSNSATVTIADDESEAMPTVTITASDPDAGEPNDNGQFTVTLSEALNETATVQYSVSGSATGGQDYVALSGNVTIPIGQRSVNILVDVIDDTEVEGEEEVTVTLNNGSAGSATIDIGSPSSATVTIADDDSVLIPPTADAGADQTVPDADGDGTGEVTLDGSGSTDPDGTIENYEWLENGQIIATGVQPTVSLAVGNHTIILRVTDNDGLTGTDSVTVTVQPRSLTATFTTELQDNNRLVIVEAQTKNNALFYSWNFGQGADPASLNGLGEFGPIEVRYANSGIKTITLAITDPSGQQGADSSSAKVAVEADPETVNDVLQALVNTDDPGERSVITAVSNACTVGNLGGDCAALLNAAAAGDANMVQQMTKAITPNDLKISSDSTINSVGMQIGNVGARIAALRAGTTSAFDIGGLSFLDGDTLISGRYLQSLGETFLTGGGASTDESGFSRWGLFVSGRISRGDRDATTLSEGFDYQIYGLTVGTDYRLRDNLILGAALGYSDTETDVDGDGGKLETDDLSGTLYGTWYRDESFFLDGSITFGRGDYSQGRNISYTLPGEVPTRQTFNADFDGDHFGMAVNAGYAYQKKAWTLTPKLRLQYIKADIDGFSETAANPGDPSAVWAVEIDGQDYKSFTSSLGLQAGYAMSQSWGVLLPYIDFEWVHEFEDNDDTVTGRFIGDLTGSIFALPVDESDSDYFNIGIGASAQFSRGRSGFLNYQRVLGYDDLDYYSINLGLRFEF